MENTTEEGQAPKKRGRKKLDLSTAKVADGALVASKSVYEMVGINDSRYKIKNIDEYEKALAKMNLIELQDEAYNKGVTANPNREVTIDRLIRRFLQENNANRIPDSVNVPSTVPKSVREIAEKTLARGR